MSSATVREAGQGRDVTSAARGDRFLVLRWVF